jgi:hypothetical protein
LFLLYWVSNCLAHKHTYTHTEKHGWKAFVNDIPVTIEMIPNATR